ncbi:hypothetical protein LINGRAHAP2_LOCUS32140 [Linum grandiflorum]
MPHSNFREAPECCLVLTGGRRRWIDDSGLTSRISELKSRTGGHLQADCNYGKQTFKEKVLKATWSDESDSFNTTDEDNENVKMLMAIEDAGDSDSDLEDDKRLVLIA